MADNELREMVTAGPAHRESARERRNREAKHAIKAVISRNRGSISEALPSGFPGGVERFERAVYNAINTGPDSLMDCDPATILGAAMSAAQLGLTPGMLGECWILPRRGKAVFQIGSAGYHVLAHRAGWRVGWSVVFEGDEFEFSKGTNPSFVHVPKLRDEGETVTPVLWYVEARDRAGDLIRWEVYDRRWVAERRSASTADTTRADSPWVKWFAEMGLKTCVADFSRRLPLAVEDPTMAAALVTDGSVRSGAGGVAEDCRPDWGSVEAVEPDVSLPAIEAVEVVEVAGTGGAAEAVAPLPDGVYPASKEELTVLRSEAGVTVAALIRGVEWDGDTPGNLEQVHQAGLDSPIVADRIMAALGL